jgi:hypothetical protein
VELLTAHHRRNPQARFVFAGADGRLQRRSNFRHRAWLPRWLVTRTWTEVRPSRGCTFMICVIRTRAG